MRRGLGIASIFSGDADPHRHRQAGITKLSVAVIERAMRDAQLVEVGHKVKVCRMEMWSDRERRHILAARRWLTDPSEKLFQLWASGSGLNPFDISESVRERVEWTEQLESSADAGVKVPSRRERHSSTLWPFRRLGQQSSTSA